jgi:hypothetical protein
MQIANECRHYLWQSSRRRGGPRVGFGPGPQPHYAFAMWKTVHLLGGSITDLADQSADVRVAWADETWVSPIHNALNGQCTDISKRRVSEAQLRAFGYDVIVDPETHVGPVVRKSEINSAHDGTIVTCPTPAIKEVIFQRVIRNELGDGRVEDLRVVIAGDRIPLVYRKRRPVGVRFTNATTETLVATSDVLSTAERRGILELARDVGLDFGELDVLRDAEDGRIYVIDINKTPFGPPGGMDRRAGRAAMVVVADAMRPLLTGAVPV